MSERKELIRWRRALRAISMSFLLGGLLFSCVSKQKYQSLKADYQDVKEENKKLSEQKSALSSRKRSLQASCSDKKERIEDLEVGIRIVQDSIDSIQGLAYDMEALKRKYRRTQTKLAQVKSINELLFGNITTLREDLHGIGVMALDTCPDQDSSTGRTRCLMYPIDDWGRRP